MKHSLLTLFVIFFTFHWAYSSEEEIYESTASSPQIAKVLDYLDENKVLEDLEKIDDNYSCRVEGDTKGYPFVDFIEGANSQKFELKIHCFIQGEERSAYGLLGNRYSFTGSFDKQLPIEDKLDKIN